MRPRIPAAESRRARSIDQEYRDRIEKSRGPPRRFCVGDWEGDRETWGKIGGASEKKRRERRETAFLVPRNGTCQKLGVDVYSRDPYLQAKLDRWPRPYGRTRDRRGRNFFSAGGFDRLTVMTVSSVNERRRPACE